MEAKRSGMVRCDNLMDFLLIAFFIRRTVSWDTPVVQTIVAPAKGAPPGELMNTTTATPNVIAIIPPGIIQPFRGKPLALIQGNR
jgi:hypothetical protein